MRSRSSARMLLTLLLSSTFMPAAHAADPDRGGQLHAKHCTACHGSEVYTRDGRMVQSLEGLEQQVARCHRSLGLGLSQDQLADLVAFLNQRYYQF